MVYVIFIFGVLVGGIITQIIICHNVGRGYFKIREVDKEADMYGVDVRLLADQDLLKVKRIILKREDDTRE